MALRRILIVTAMLALVGCGGTGSPSGGSAGVASTTETETADQAASRACADAFNGMSPQQKMEIAFKTYNLANAGGNSPARWIQAIRVRVGGLRDHSNQCLLTIMYPPTPAEYSAAKSIGREPDFYADQFTFYSDGSNLQRGANGPARSLPDSVRVPNASLSLSGSGNNLDAQLSLS